MKKFLALTTAATMLLSTNVFAAETAPVAPDTSASGSTIAVPISTMPIAPQQRPSFHTNETTTIKVAPDMATVNVRISNTDSTSAKAKALNDAASASVTKDLVAGGLVKEDSISTSNFYMYPNTVYDNETGKSSIDGYYAETSLEIKVTDLSKLNDIFDTILETDTATISYVTFQTSKYDEYYNQALSQSIKKAKTRANYVATNVFDSSNIQITDITSNGGYYDVSPVYGDSIAKSSDASNYVPRTIDVSATATVSFVIN